eukprot:750162_1
MTIRKSIHVAFEQVSRSVGSESLHCLSDNLKHAQKQIDKTNINSHEGYQLTSKPTTKLKSKSKPKSILKKHSPLKSDSNPVTVAPKTKIKNGKPLTVHWDDKVIVHEVAYWDRCGKTFPEVVYWDPCGETFPDYFSEPVEGVPETILITKKSNKSEKKSIAKKSNKSKKYSFFSKKKSKKKRRRYRKIKKKKKKNSKVAAFVLAG